MKSEEFACCKLQKDDFEYIFSSYSEYNAAAHPDLSLKREQVALLDAIKNQTENKLQLLRIYKSIFEVI